MNRLGDVLQWLYDTGWATEIRESEIVFPAIETVHVLAIALMVGTIAVVDLRLLGLVYRDVPMAEVERRVVRATWAGFALLAVTGFLLFAAEAVKIQDNLAFQVKLLLLLVAGVNMAVFHIRVRPLPTGVDAPLPTSARRAAIVSLLAWTGVVAAGRAIAYF